MGILDSQLNVPETFSLIAGKEGTVMAHPDPILLTRNDNQRIVTTGGRQYVVEPGTANILRTQKAGEKDLTGRCRRHSYNRSRRYAPGSAIRGCDGGTHGAAAHDSLLIWRGATG